MKRNIGSFQISVPQRRRVPTPNGGTELVVEKPTQHTVIIDIDLEAIASKLGERAVRSKGGKSHLAGGLITVTEKRR